VRDHGVFTRKDPQLVKWKNVNALSGIERERLTDEIARDNIRTEEARSKCALGARGGAGKNGARWGRVFPRELKKSMIAGQGHDPREDEKPDRDTHPSGGQAYKHPKKKAHHVWSGGRSELGGKFAIHRNQRGSGNPVYVVPSTAVKRKGGTCQEK